MEKYEQMQLFGKTEENKDSYLVKQFSADKFVKKLLAKN